VEIPTIILFPPAVEGLLGAAAALRWVGREQDLQALAPHETARRLYGLAAEPQPRNVIMIDVVPTDSVDTLVLPAVQRLLGAGRTVSWYLGRGDGASPDAPGPVPGLHLVRGEAGWHAICEETGDQQFALVAAAILGLETADARCIAWREVLAAVSTSWDWTRLYASVRRLAALGEPDPAEMQWAAGQIGEVSQAGEAIRQAPVRTLAGARVAVVDDQTIAAKVRLDTLAGERPDVDAVAFVSGPGRLKVIATPSGKGLGFLDALDGLEEDIEDGVQLAGSIWEGAASLSWNPEAVPAPIGALVAPELFRSTDPADIAAAGQISHDAGNRIAKGLDAASLAPEDRAILREGLSGEQGSADDEWPSDSPGQTRPDKAGADRPALRTGERLLPTHPPE